MHMGEYEPRDSRKVTGAMPQDQSVDAAGKRQSQDQMRQQGQMNQQGSGGQQPGGQQWASQQPDGQQPDGQQPGGQQQQFQRSPDQMNEGGQRQAGQLGGASGMAGQAAGGVRGQLREHMEIVGADGAHVGTIDSIEGDRIKLTRRDSGMGSHQGHHHYLPLSLVAGIEGDRVRLSANGDIASRMAEEE